ncbi:MAG: hypothetical protein HDS29_00685 [Bacteroides sp.]|nr:hypothetical protein [Bacteroides sp.]
MKHTRINSQLCASSRFSLNCSPSLHLADQRRQRSAIIGAVSALAYDRRSALKPGSWLRSRFGMTRKQMESPDDISLSSFMEDCLNQVAAVAKRNLPTRSRRHVRNCKKIHSSHLPRAPDIALLSV